MGSSEQPTGAVAEQFREYLHMLARVHLSPPLQTKLDASDIVQETLLKAIAKQDQFRGSNSAEMAGWLRRILTNELGQAVRRLRSQKQDIRLERSLEATFAETSMRLENWLGRDDTSPSEQVARHELLLQFAEALAALPDDQRAAVELRHLHGWTLREISQEMDRTTASVAGLLRRGLAVLRMHLKE